jgi:hypothetical protein
VPAELNIQPGNRSRLTLMAGPVRGTLAGRRRDEKTVVAICECERLVIVIASAWLDGSRRPKMCAVCTRDTYNREHNPYGKRLPRADILPDYRYARSR